MGSLKNDPERSFRLVKLWVIKNVMFNLEKRVSYLFKVRRESMINSLQVFLMEESPT